MKLILTKASQVEKALLEELKRAWEWRPDGAFLPIQIIQPVVEKYKGKIDNILVNGVFSHLIAQKYVLAYDSNGDAVVKITHAGLDRLKKIQDDDRTRKFALIGTSVAIIGLIITLLNNLGVFGKH